MSKGEAALLSFVYGCLPGVLAAAGQFQPRWVAWAFGAWMGLWVYRDMARVIDGRD